MSSTVIISLALCVCFFLIFSKKILILFLLPKFEIQYSISLVSTICQFLYAVEILTTFFYNNVIRIKSNATLQCEIIIILPCFFLYGDFSQFVFIFFFFWIVPYVFLGESFFWPHEKFRSLCSILTLFSDWWYSDRMTYAEPDICIECISVVIVFVIIVVVAVVNCNSTRQWAHSNRK